MRRYRVVYGRRNVNGGREVIGFAWQEIGVFASRAVAEAVLGKFRRTNEDRLREGDLCAIVALSA